MALTAQTKMKALVVSRLMLGDINDWQTFERERIAASQISNRRTARSVSSQIGRNYRILSIEMETFIQKNFSRCDYGDLSRLCDAIRSGVGLSLRLDEFESTFFPLNNSVKSRVPFYTHICISTYGMQFEFPEHHFINDLVAGFADLKETQRRINDLNLTDKNVKGKRSETAPLVAREKFISRSMTSAAFSLVEAFVSGLFFTAVHVGKLGHLSCDEDFLRYAKNKESAALKDRIDRLVRFASQHKANGVAEPFKSFIEIGKHFRDAIHHTTPFGRKDLEAGQRLEALYEVKFDVAILCTLLALETVDKLSFWIYGEGGGGEIAEKCVALRSEILAHSVK